MRDKLTPTLILGFLFFLASCEVVDKEEQVPVYMQLDRIDFDAGYKHGTDSAEISDAWVYVDNELIGAFELPAEFPVLTEGRHTLSIFPGVIINGISATRVVNPFMEKLEFDINPVAGDTINIRDLGSVESTYQESVTFAWNESIGQEDFEDAGISFDTLEWSNVAMEKTKLEVYEGTYSGWIHMDEGHKNFLAVSTQDFPIVTGSRPVFLELHIKNPDHIMEIGFYESYGGGTVLKSSYILINPGEEWKKLYINLTPHMPVMTGAEDYKIYFQSALRSDKTEGDIYVDNIKLIYE